MFEGPVLAEHLTRNNISPAPLFLLSLIFHFLGLISGGCFIRSPKNAKQALVAAILSGFAGTILFISDYVLLWKAAIPILSFITAFSLCGIAYFFKKIDRKNIVINVSYLLILTNIIMTLFLIIFHFAGHYTLYCFLINFVIAGILLKKVYKAETSSHQYTAICPPKNIRSTLVYLYLLIMLLSVNGGIMYSIIPFSLCSDTLFWKIYLYLPYIAGVLFFASASKKLKEAYGIYISLSITGFSMIFILISAGSYIGCLVTNTLLLFALGINDIFWWKLLAERFEFSTKPAFVLGLGLSANIIGIFTGKEIIRLTHVTPANVSPAAITGFIIVFITIPMLPALVRHLKTHNAFCQKNSDSQETNNNIKLSSYEGLSERESEITTLLIQGMPNKKIAETLFISENTVKTHIKNIYIKKNVKNRIQLVNNMGTIKESQQNV